MSSLKFIFLALSFAFWAPGAMRKTADKPNVILIFMDDMGYGDLASYGALYDTPNLDKMAAEGMRFTQFYAAQAVCSASRAALLTGCYPNRMGIWGALMPWSETGIAREEKTLGEMFKEIGYQTAVFGKWHLGHKQPYLPLQHGFDEFLGIPYSNDMWPVGYAGKPITDTSDWKSKYPVLPLISGNETIEEIRDLEGQDKLTSLLTEKAIDFIHRNKKAPFFLYFPHPMVHVPLGASEKFKGKSGWSLYADVVQEIDWSVGQIMQTLRELDLDKNTLVIFTSDNGPWQNFGNHAGSTGGLREGKGASFDGGVKVPCIMRWPGKIPAGTVCNKLSATLDLFPTLTAICGGKAPDLPIDGVDLWPLLSGKANLAPRAHFWYYYDRNSLQAVRDRRWKLVFPHAHRSYRLLPGNDRFPGPTATDTTGLALYDLYRDPGERYDVKDLYPEVVQELQRLGDQARAELGDDLTKTIGNGLRGYVPK
jgi:arylsulfatase A-like enzyme